MKVNTFNFLDQNQTVKLDIAKFQVKLFEVVRPVGQLGLELIWKDRIANSSTFCIVDCIYCEVSQNQMKSRIRNCVCSGMGAIQGERGSEIELIYFVKIQSV